MTLQPSRFLAGLLITGLLHVAIYVMFFGHQKKTEISDVRRDAIQWLLPIARLASSRPPTARLPHPLDRPRKTEKAVKATSGNISQGAIEPRPVAAESPSATADDPFALPEVPHSPKPHDILQQARRDVGKIDRELRVTYPERAPIPGPDSKQMRLERGINAAHNAVPPKWYEGARIVELSTPDGENKTRTYKIVTALLTYCINIRPDGKKSYTSCPD
jgi:hypothetical protein